MTRWTGTNAELIRLLEERGQAVPDVLREPEARPRKYGNVPTVVDGIRFDSKAEAKRYGELKLLERAGEIRDLTCHPSYPIAGKACYVADFAYIEGGRQIAEDVKGGQATKTPTFRLKAKLFRERHPDIELRIVER